MQERITALVLAGSRPGVDPLADAAGVATKALVPIAGRPMIDHVARTLADHPHIDRIVLMAQQPEILTGHPHTEWLRTHDKIELHASGSGISQSLLDWLDGEGGDFPILVTTADNVLLDAPMIDAFVAGSGGADIAAAMVERQVLLTRYPQSRRTWLKFRGGAWSGANLFWLGSGQARNVLAKWRDIEQDRKKGWKIISAFGPALLLGAALRLLSIHQAIARAGRRLGAQTRIVPLPFAEACIDADKQDDIALIEQIMARRAA
ncbi:MAG: nucleotidyltransferase family protein [Sphingobium sp.]|nr:nucleotidyltransferase family protein [Sphingobium sp.]MCP5399555.1 NTP transferase domain-containing protein [Sphingomonas sp.]